MWGGMEAKGRAWREALGADAAPSVQNVGLQADAERNAHGVRKAGRSSQDLPSGQTPKGQDGDKGAGGTGRREGTGTWPTPRRWPRCHCHPGSEPPRLADPLRRKELPLLCAGPGSPLPGRTPRTLYGPFPAPPRRPSAEDSAWVLSAVTHTQVHFIEHRQTWEACEHAIMLLVATEPLETPGAPGNQVCPSPGETGNSLWWGETGLGVPDGSRSVTPEL